MDAIIVAFMLLLAVAASGIILRLSPVKLPGPIVQILIGMVLASLLHFDVRLDPGVFFLLFVPLLLFFDGWRIPKRAFFRDLRPILALAVGLVIFTVVGVGFFVHWLIPAVSLAMSFALAAVLAPTDAVAVSAVATRASIPGRLMSIIEGEALLSVLSALTRLDIDAWQEAANLVRMSRERATERLASLIGTLPEETQAHQDWRTTAVRLIAPLPRKAGFDSVSREVPPSGRAPRDSRAVLYIILLSVLLVAIAFGSRYFMASHRPPARVGHGDASVVGKVSPKVLPPGR